ncbi:MATE family efflux transporter [Natronoarchaeum rubrum]|uniref:MATE family efflux transporter n=1 Tax=Natronoarchaeum rubrum TaxID=755311 RepID=UPI002112FC26|nr:MATE family efflux transporter [Natronoarchaeum rubrum]
MSEREDRSVDVVDGELFKPLVVLSAPIVMTMLLQVGYNLADTYWVGRLGSEAVAALSYSWSIVFLMVSVGGGFTVAGTVLVAQNKGAGQSGRSHHVAGQTIAFVTLLSLAFSLLGFVLTPTLLRLIGADPSGAAFQYAVDYTRVVFAGLQFMFWFFIFNALMRGWGDTRTPLYLMFGSVVLNVVIDPIFILGFDGNPLFAALGLEGLEASLYAATGFEGWSVMGAGVATVLSRGLAAIVGLYMLFSGWAGLQPTFADLRLKRDTVRKIVDIGLPTAGEQSFRSLGITALTAIVAIAGTDAVAAYGIVQRLASLVFLPAIGLARGTETVVGQNLGAQQVERAKRAVIMSATMITVVFLGVGAVAYTFAEPITGVFVTGEGAADVIDVGSAYLVICAPAFAFLGVFQVVLGGFRGSGSTRTAMLLSIQELWIYRIPLAYLLLVYTDLGVVGVWYAMAFSYVASALTTGGWFLRGTWTDNEVDEERAAAATAD